MFLRLKFGSGKVSPESAGKEPAASSSTPENRETISGVAVEEQAAASARTAEPPQPPEPQPVGVPRIKTYKAPDMRQAMAAARRELGEDAILIHSKRLDPVGDDKLRYEVTFGVITGASPSSTALAAPAPNLQSTTPATDTAWAQEFGRLREEIASLQAYLARHYWQGSSPASGGPKSGDLRNLLVRQGVDDDLASEWALALEDSLSADDTKATEEISAASLAPILHTRIRVDASMGWDESQGKAVLFLGPPASGKTTALVKIALEYGIKRGRAVEILSLDRGAQELDHKIETFAAMLNVPRRAFRSAQALAAALSATRPENALVLVDTSGFGTGSIDQDEELSRLIETGARLDSHLVLSAAWQPSAVRRAVDRYEIFRPSRLLFTMLDQTEAFGPLLQEPWRTGKPLSFFNNGALGNGQIRTASLESVLESMEPPVAK